MSRLFVCLACVLVSAAQSTAADRPNVLWITCEDMSADLGCYGSPDARTPHLDAFSKTAVRYANAFTVAPVCAPSRSCLITGNFGSTIGSHHMRSKAALPDSVRCFSEHLRRAGYYCTNNAKQDYNFATPKESWDESNNKAHYRKRKPGQPFFAVFNLTVTHESQVRAAPAAFRRQTAALSADQRHDPDKVTVPPFHPDAPAVRRDWANYHDLVSAMDAQAGQLLRELDADKLADDTVVFFFSDHGAGLPRGKRWLYDTGLRVPLLVRAPEKYKAFRDGEPGTATDRLVSFVDFAPTVLRVCGVDAPTVMQGVPFLGAANPREYVHAGRDRMDERRDMSRAVRDKRYKYIRNYYPQVPWSQPLEYMDMMPTMKEWRRLAAAGQLRGPASLWMRPAKPAEELYDTQIDPHELANLADKSESRHELERLRAELRRWTLETRDLGLLPEAEMHARAAGGSFLELGQDPGRFAPSRLHDAALAASSGDVAKLKTLSADADAAVRYWAVTGLGTCGGADDVRPMLADASAVVRVAAADALGRLGQHAEALPVLVTELKNASPWVRLAAVSSLDGMGDKAAAAREAVRPLLKDGNEYVERVARHMLGEPVPAQ